ncbi:MAG: UDP-N-acetylmuramoyl-L-alanine--D-glutamate ligase [Burkholderiales bacterium]|nr:UDP-N-acetylmuramoyl-L-alanine--D-glutamate ligase [Burkholderiales bacterium]
MTAAREAAAFVAQLFTDAGTPEPTAQVAPDDNNSAASQEEASACDAAPEPVVSPLQGQQVLVLGLGASGLAMARWCVRQGARVTVADTRETPPQLAQLQAELPQVEFRAGAFETGLVEGQGIRAVFKSPGLTPAMVAPVWQAAQAMGLWVGGEVDLFARALRDLRAGQAYAPKVLAITGTNGKTTVTSLTGQLVAHAEKTVAVAGNIGPNLLDVLAQHLDAGTLPEVWVLELSSFQLDGVQGFEPTAAVVLNLTQDHLDWHGSMEAYGAAKARIFGDQGLLVLNRDDAAVMAMLPEPVRVRLQKPQWREYLSFGVEMPQRPGDYGIEMVNGMAWLVRAQEADETQKRKKGEEEEIFIQRLMPADALRIRGRHNATNALAALALAQAAGCALGPMLYGLREYRGEPHRVEPVAIVNGVEYFDDSKGTNVGATVAALTGLGTERRIVVILGGDGKGQDFAPLFGPVQRYARAVVLIGRDAPAIRAAVQDTGVPLLDAGTLPEAVALARVQAQAGDAVLLSPACASFDMFKDYEHRASVFVEAVQALSDEGGLA